MSQATIRLVCRMGDAGLNLRYCDEHMGFDWPEGVGERLEQFARREGLLRGGRTIPGLPDAEGEFDDVDDKIVARLAGAAAGMCLLVGRAWPAVHQRT